MTNQTNDKDLHPQILRMQKIAEENDGKLLDMEWEGTRAKYRFLYDKDDESSCFVRTARGIFETDWPDYKNNKTCFLKQKTKNKTPEEKLKEMDNLALLNGARLLSKEWISTTTKCEFEINNKKIYISYKYLISNGWPKKLAFFVCSRNNRDSAQKYQHIISLASKYNFTLLSPEYKNRDTLLKFLNNENDEVFFMSYRSVMNGMLESQSIGKKGLIAEPVCKQVIEHLFKNKFIKRTDILIPEITGRKKYLELDGYCEELKIAFEYQGHPSHWNVNHYNYIKVSERDKEKEQFCKQLGIILLSIPDFGKTRNFCEKELIELITQIVEKKFIEENKKLPTLNKSNFVINYEKINHAKYMINKMKQLAEDNNAELLSKKWFGNQKEYDFRKDNKNFKIRYCKLEEKGWPKNLEKYLSLSDGHKKTNEQLIEELKNYAKQNNLILIDEKWVNVKHKHIFKSEINNEIILLSKGQINKILKKPIKKEKNLMKSQEKIKQNNEKNLLKLQEYVKDSAELISNKWEGRQAYYNFKWNGTIISFKAEYLSKKGFPENIDKFLKQSKASKAGHKTRTN